MAAASIGTKLLIGANSVAELTSIGGLDLSADTIETTTLDSDGWRTFAQGLKDGGEVSISGYFNPGDTNGQLAVKDGLDNGTLLPLVIIFPSLGAQWNFNGIVTGLSTSAELEDNISFEATIKVSGKPSLGLTPSAGPTAISVTGAGGTLAPTFTKTTPYYTYAGVTATSVNVTVTAAGHNISMFVNGQFVQTLQSGVASNPIALSSIGTSADIIVTVSEPGKTQRLYEIIAVKTA